MPPATPWLQLWWCFTAIPSPRQLCLWGPPTPKTASQGVVSRQGCPGSPQQCPGQRYKLASCAVGPSACPIAPGWASRVMGLPWTWDMVTWLMCWLGAMCAVCWDAMRLPCHRHLGQPSPHCVGQAVLQQCAWTHFGVHTPPEHFQTPVSHRSAHQCQPRGGPCGHPPRCLCPPALKALPAHPSGGDAPRCAVGKLRHGASRSGGPHLSPRCGRLPPPPRRRHGPSAASGISSRLGAAPPADPPPKGVGFLPPPPPGTRRWLPGRTWAPTPPRSCRCCWPCWAARVSGAGGTPRGTPAWDLRGGTFAGGSRR